MLAGPRGVSGVTDDGEVVLDVHHQDHPQSRDRKGRAGILFMGTGDYAALRERYGDHVIDGIAGETMLLDAPDGLAGGDLPDTVTVRPPPDRWNCTASGPPIRASSSAGSACARRSRRWWTTRSRQTLIDLDGGARGYRSIASAEGTIAVGDVVTIADETVHVATDGTPGNDPGAPGDPPRPIARRSSPPTTGCWAAGPTRTNRSSSPRSSGPPGCIASGPPDAPPVVLIHAYQATSAEWMELARALSTDQRVFAVDVNGDAGPQHAPDRAISTPADLVEWLDTVLDGLG